MYLEERIEALEKKMEDLAGTAHVHPEQFGAVADAKADPPPSSPDPSPPRKWIAKNVPGGSIHGINIVGDLEFEGSIEMRQVTPRDRELEALARDMAQAWKVWLHSGAAGRSINLLLERASALGLLKDGEVG